MTPARLRGVSLAALAVPIALTAISSPASPPLAALALAGAAGGAALLLAGPALRTIVAVLIAVLGGCVVLVGVASAADDGLGVLGVVAGAAQAIVAGGVAVTARRWPTPTSRYDRSGRIGDRASEWDALSDGEDPTDSPQSID